MKQFIIIPAHEMEGMFGYSAIAIERTNKNLLILHQIIVSLTSAKAIDEDITKLVYENPKLDIELLNNEFEPRVDAIHLKEFTEEDLEIYTEPGDCKVNTPSLTISHLGFKIQYFAEYSETEVFCEFTIEEVLNILK
jgi:hypothetical protein